MRKRISSEEIEARVRERTAELEESRLDIVWRLAKAGEYRDKGNGNHVVRIGYYCRAISQALGASDEFVRTMFLTSPLHDIGKIAVPDTILLKPGVLTEPERRVIEQHCIIGAEILREYTGHSQESGRAPYNNPLLSVAARIAMSHHERWDGRGYPEGLSGEETPVEARIVAIADTYDALRSVRPYKPAYSDVRALSIMKEESGGHFDPTVFAAFEAAIEELRQARDEFPDEDWQLSQVA